MLDHRIESIDLRLTFWTPQKLSCVCHLFNSSSTDMESNALFVSLCFLLILLFILIFICKSRSEVKLVQWCKSRDMTLTDDEGCRLTSTPDNVTPSSTLTLRPSVKSSSSPLTSTHYSKGCMECHRSWKDCCCTVVLYRQDDNNATCSDILRKINETGGAVLRTSLMPKTRIGLTTGEFRSSE